MARTRKSASALFDAITLEGSLITPAMLSRVAAHQAGAQSEADYKIPKGLTLRDEISRYFRIGQALFKDLFVTTTPSTSATSNFTEALLRDVFGFSDLRRAGMHTVGDRSFPVTMEALCGRVPVVVVPPSDALDRASNHLHTEGRRRSAASSVQDWLNVSDEALWGFCCNGERLRLVRDNASLTRPAYVEANLRQLFDAEDFADFAALWLLIHVTRFGIVGAPIADCALERWREACSKEGESARERLRGGVKAALLALGNGFLSHSDNTVLRERIGNNQLQLPDFFGQLLRLVYRLIFLLAAEDRGLLHLPGVSTSIRKLYADGYSLGALRDSAVRRSTWDRHHDRWEGLLITFAALSQGEPELGLPALGGIFDTGVIPELESIRISNRSLMEAVYRLAWLKDSASLMPVNWRDMETEELGSVYEGLLELTPRLTDNGRGFAFAEGAETKGNERKTTGSYYTPDSLVQALLDSALDPVLDRVESEADDAAADLLGVTVIDPACGSGHFLLAAARRIATRIANARAEGVASADDYRHALRDVARSCIHGVDRNPMAVELTKVALWIETVEPGKPLGFLDANIRCGDSLLGVYDLEVLREGIPDAAYKPLSGDDKVTARDFEKRNKAERTGQGALRLFGSGGSLPAPPPLAGAASAVRRLPEDNPQQIAEKRRQFANAARETQRWQWRQAADAYIAAFLVPKTKQEAHTVGTATIPTTEDVFHLISGNSVVYGPRVGRIQHLIDAANPFHWPLEFPDIMEKGGFDVVLGNPPWERIKIQEQEFFASREPEIVEAPNAAARGRMIIALKDSAEGTREHNLFDEFETAKRIAEASSVFAHIAKEDNGRFPLTGRGDINTYALFAELFATLANARGRAGVIVPTGIATDATTAPFFDTLMSENRIVSLYDFQTGLGFFDRIGHARFKFCLLTVTKQGGNSKEVKFSFFSRTIAEFSDERRHFKLSSEKIERLNPNTRTAPIFRTQMDAELTAKIYDRVPVIIDDTAGAEGNPWEVSFLRMFDMAGDSGIFRTAEQMLETGFSREGMDWIGAEAERYVPLYQAKMIHQFNHRWATYDGTESRDTMKSEWTNSSFEATPRYWVPEKVVRDKLVDKNWCHQWLIGWRDICRATDERTLISGLIPASGCGDKFLLLFTNAAARIATALYGSLNSLACDYAARQKVGGTSLKYFTFKQLPVLPPSAYDESALAYIVPRVLELTYTSHSMAPFARDLGYDGQPFAWDEERRALLRAELDAWYARAYGLTLDELRYILDPGDVKGEDYPSETFRVLKNNEMKRIGEFRTRRLVLEAWDRLSKIDAKPVSIPAHVLPSMLPDRAWVMPAYNTFSVQVQLAAILKKLQGPTPTVKVRLAMLYALQPRYLTPYLADSEKKEWKRLVGDGAIESGAANVVNFVGNIKAEWRDAYTQLRGMKALIEDLKNDSWAPGSAVQEFHTESWPDGRADFVLRALEGMNVEKSVSTLPTDVQAWVRGHAA